MTKRFAPPPIHWPARAACAASAQAKPRRAPAIPALAPLNVRRIPAPAVATRAAQAKPGPAAMPPPPPRPAARAVQRAATASTSSSFSASGSGGSGAPVAEDVRPFVDPAYRTAIAPVDIIGAHKGTYAYQVTKVRNLPGIRRLGLVPSQGGSRVGLSQNPSQSASLFAASMKHSRGRVTVGTGSVVIDNYRRKGQDWHDRLEADLDLLARSQSDGAIYSARGRLRAMAWLHDPLLDELLDFPLEDSGVREDEAALTATVREAFRVLHFHNWLNKPYILRLPSRSAAWSVDPDDPQGYQTETAIGVDRIELLLDGSWVRLAAPEIADYLERIEGAIAEEREALQVGRRVAARRRWGQGLMGADVPREVASDIADMLNL